jgi:cytochrome c biogenesis protein CcdA/thiol-disulfide isomerase/thioredoxin
MLTFFTSLILLTTPAQPVVHFFYSPSCGHCTDILLGDIPGLQAKYSFILKKYDIDILDNLKVLEKMEEKVVNKTDDMPVVFVGDSAFYGPVAVRKKLGPTLKILALHDHDTTVTDTNRVVADTSKNQGAAINLYYFYQLECPECDRTESLLQALARQYISLHVHKYDIRDDSCIALYEALALERSIPEEMRLLVPAVFIGDQYLVKDFGSTELESLITRYKNGSPRLDTLITTAGAHSIIERFSRFSIIGIVLAGLLDGINPCAFATIVFFISYLLFIGRRRKDVLIMSASFIVSVFVCYFAIGIGAYGLMKYLARFSVIARALFLLFGIAAIIMGFLSLYDFFVVLKNDRSKMILQLPLVIKQRIHDGIKDKTRAGGIIAGSAVAGFLVSFLEFGCTGQVYLPTIMFMISGVRASLKPLWALLLYNIAFIVPLAVIAAAAIVFSTQLIARHLEKRIPLVKIATAALFFILGVVLLISIL